MGSSSSLCYSDTDVAADYSPAYLGQIYAGVILNSARTTSTGYMRGQGRYRVVHHIYIRYASTLSLNSIYASTLSLNSCAASRKNSLAG